MKGNKDLAALDRDVVHLLSSWFNRGFLVLRRIDWSTPANILEQIIRYEAVHEIRDWNDLRRRIDPVDRRCYAFFHPQLNDEPLIFVEVALTETIPTAIAPLLAAERQPVPIERARTAVFYSISNTQKGLAGVSFGNFLIKQVVEDLKRELPNLRTFVTLSPAPGFAGWLKRVAADPRSAGLDGLDTAFLRAALDDPGWHRDAAAVERLRPKLLPLAAAYFLRAKGPSGKPLDPVARFHLGNGARLERLNWPGDVSPKGLREAAGLMVNYLYDPRYIEANHEAFAADGTVAASNAVQRLSRELPQKTAAELHHG
jgi:malonyl-CoA decarboxylase